MIISINLKEILNKIDKNIILYKILMNANKKIMIWNKLWLKKWENNYLIEIYEFFQFI